MFSKNYIFYLFALYVITAACTKQNSSKDQDKPNFVFIAVDDLNTFNSVLGDQTGIFLEKVYPDTAVRNRVLKRLTPNLDKFSEQALTFTNAFCASPLCGPSRTALLTGLPAHVSGYYSHEKHFRNHQNLAKVVTLPQYLRKHGYYTTGIGKVFHKTRAVYEKGFFSDWPDRLFSWDDWVDAYAGTGASAVTGKHETETLSAYYDVEKYGPNYFKRFGVTDLDSKYSNDYQNAEHIANLLVNRQSVRKDIHGQVHHVNIPDDKPWFMACGIFAPHLPWIAPQPCYDLFPQNEMQIDEALIAWVDSSLTDLSETGYKITHNSSFNDIKSFGREVDGVGGDINGWKAVFQAYLATIAYADQCMKLLFDAIEENPEHKNTIVVLWSDHGYHVGDKNRKGKTTLWEASNQCNLMIYDPRNGTTSTGQKCKTGVSLQDIYPTVVELAGLKRPSHIYGRALTDEMDDPTTPWVDPVLSTYQKGNHTIRTPEYRYIRFKNGDQELYNMVKDPFELINLAQDKNYTGTCVEMSFKLDAILNKSAADYE